MNHQKVNISEKMGLALKNILGKIEKELDWGGSVTWAGSDFENLSDLIREKTGHSLSVSTLKRIWGRTSQSVQPSVTTMNILAEYLGEKSWRVFASGDLEVALQGGPEKSGISKLRQRVSTYGFTFLGFIMLFSIYKFTLTEKDSDNNLLDTKDVVFDLKKVTIGLPNTVVFKYDLGEFDFDSLELQQTWDVRKRTLLDPKDSIITATYMTPGYFNAKLVADGEILKSQNLYLPSEGLKAFAINAEGERRALSEQYWSFRDEGFKFHEELYKQESGLVPNSLMLVNLLNEPIVSADAFKAEVSLKIPYSDSDPCSPVSILVTGSDDVYMFTLGVIGCSGKFGSYLGGQNISGQNKDLSALGFTNGQENHLIIRKEGTNLWAGSNGKEILLSDEVPYIGRIGGMRLFFDNEITVSKIKISDQKEEIDLMK